MIASIKKKYICAVMLSVIAVIGVIITFINTVNYISTDERSNIRLDFIAKTHNLNPPVEQEPPTGEEGEEDTENNVINAETPFDTRYFTVSIRLDGTIVGTDVQRVKRITHERAIILAASAFDKESKSGYVDGYTWGNIAKSGKAPGEYLENNDSYNALSHSNGLIITGATGTNVNDLYALIIQPK